jgi:lipoprotein-releasing system permease protein
VSAWASLITSGQSMRYELFLALRQLRSRRKRSATRVTTIVAMAGVAIGVAALIVSLSLANGFRDEMRDKILRGTAHLTVMRADGQPLVEYREVIAKLRSLEGVNDAAGTTYDGAVVIGPKASAYTVLRGIDPESGFAREEISHSLIEGSGDALEPMDNNRQPPPAILGAELASRTGLKLNDVAEVIPASASNSSGKKGVVRVAGIFRSGLFEYDSTWMYVPLNAGGLANESHTASVVSVQLKNIYDAKRVGGNIQRTLGSAYATLDWQEANRPLFTALALERRMGLFVIALIVFIGTINITSALILVVVERRREIAILGAMGATRKSVVAIFVIQGGLIGLAGTAAGLVLGVMVCFLSNYYKLVSLPADVYSISYVPFHPRPLDLLLAALVALALSIVATLYPARAAAKVRPVEMLRDS